MRGSMMVILSMVEYGKKKWLNLQYMEMPKTY